MAEKPELVPCFLQPAEQQSVAGGGGILVMAKNKGNHTTGLALILHRITELCPKATYSQSLTQRQVYTSALQILRQPHHRVTPNVNAPKNTEPLIKAPPSLTPNTTKMWELVRKQHYRCQLQVPGGTTDQQGFHLVPQSYGHAYLSTYPVQTVLSSDCHLHLPAGPKPLGPTPTRNTSA